MCITIEGTLKILYIGLHTFCKNGKSTQFYHHSPYKSLEFRYISQTPVRSFYGFKIESHIRIVPRQELCLISILLNTLNFLIHNNDKIVMIGLHFGGLKSWRVCPLRLVRMPALTLSHTHVDNLVNTTTWKWLWSFVWIATLLHHLHGFVLRLHLALEEWDGHIHTHRQLESASSNEMTLSFSKVSTPYRSIHNMSSTCDKYFWSVT